MINSLFRSYVKDNSIITLGNILVNIKGVLLIPIIIKTVGVSTYGGFVLISSILGVVYGISSFGAGFKAQRFLPSATEISARQKLFYNQFYFQLFSILLLSFLLVLFRNSFNYVFFNNEISYSVFIIPLYLISSVLYSQVSLYFRYTSRVQYMTLTGIFFAYVDVVIILLYFYFYNYLTINILLFSHVASALLIVIPCFWVIGKEIGIKFNFFKYRDLISNIKIGFPLVLNFIVDFILAGSDRYLIGLFLGLTSIGYYNPAYMVGSLIILFPKAMGGAIPQLLSKAVDNKKEKEAQKIIDYSLKIFLLLAIPYIFGTIIFGKPILTLLANSDVAQNSYLLIPIIAFGILFYGLNLILSNILFVRMETTSIFKMNLIAAIFNLLANIIFIYFFRNIHVAAITTLLSYIIAFIYVYMIVRKVWPVNIQYVVIVKSVLASLVMSCLLFSISRNFDNNESITILIGEVVLGILIYFGALLVLKTFSAKELAFFIKRN